MYLCPVYKNLLSTHYVPGTMLDTEDKDEYDTDVI